MSKQTDLINIPDAITVDGNTIYVDSNGQDAGYNPLQIGNTSNSNTIVQILSANNGIGTIHFGDAASGSGRYIGFMNYDHTIDQFQIGTNDSSRFKIDASGRVTTPNQPAFVATNISTNTIANEGTPIFNNTVTNRGSIYNTSNGRFTVTVAGLYALGAHVRVHSDTNTISYHRVSFTKNGSYIQHTRGRLEGRTSGDYSYIANYLIIELAVNDYIATRVETASGTTLNISGNDECSFYGHLIG